jgi:hypothetical protein
MAELSGVFRAVRSIGLTESKELHAQRLGEVVGLMRSGNLEYGMNRMHQPAPQHDLHSVEHEPSNGDLEAHHRPPDMR